MFDSPGNIRLTLEQTILQETWFLATFFLWVGTLSCLASFIVAQTESVMVRVVKRVEHFLWLFCSTYLAFCFFTRC